MISFVCLARAYKTSCSQSSNQRPFISIVSDLAASSLVAAEKCRKGDRRYRYSADVRSLLRFLTNCLDLAVLPLFQYNPGECSAN